MPRLAPQVRESERELTAAARGRSSCGDFCNLGLVIRVTAGSGRCVAPVLARSSAGQRPGERGIQVTLRRAAQNVGSGAGREQLGASRPT